MIAIHQSQFLSWVPLYYVIMQSDVFIVMDDVQYQKNGVQNRNQIKTSNGKLWLTLPVESKFGLKINEIKLIEYDKNIKKIIKTLYANYSKARFFHEIMPKLEEIFNQSYGNLHDLNNAVLLYFLELLQCKTKIYYSSQFTVNSKKGDLVLDLILSTDERCYLSGSGGLSYMDLDTFKAHGVDVVTYQFQYRPYNQLWENQGFVSQLSILDLLFNNLDYAKNYIQENGKIVQL